VVDVVFKTLFPFSDTYRAGKLGDNAVDFVTNLVDNPLSIKLCPLTVTSLTRFPKECFLHGERKYPSSLPTPRRTVA
jgi:hypothetical protein